MTPDPTLATPQLLTDQDLYLFNEGSNYRIYDKMGAHLVTLNGQSGAVFSVWAPNARTVSVVGSFNGWDPKSHHLSPRGSSGIWEGFVPGVSHGALYKFHIESHTTDTASTKPIRSACCTKSLRAPPPSSGISTTNGATTTGCRSAPSATRCALRSPFTKCISARGCASPKSTTVRSPIAKPRRASPNTSDNWDSPTSNSCPSWSIPSTVPGDIRPPDTSLPPRATARRRISCTSSTTCTSTASA